MLRCRYKDLGQENIKVQLYDERDKLCTETKNYNKFLNRKTKINFFIGRKLKLVQHWKNVIWKTTHISDLLGSANGIEDENNQMLHVACTIV